MPVAKKKKSAVKAKATGRKSVKKTAPKARSKTRQAVKARRSPAKKAVGLLDRLKWAIGIGAPLILVMAVGRLVTDPQIKTVVDRAQSTAVQGTSAPKPDAWGALMRGFASADHGTVSDRIAFWSDVLWHSPQANAKLYGITQAPKIEDTAPLIPEKYDCTTYVETVASLARSHAPQDFYGNLLKIRYRNANATYVDRNHFPEADWIPNNVTAGILKDVTAEVAQQAGVQAAVVTKLIDRAAWMQAQVNRGKADRTIASAFATSGNAKPRQAQVTYLPARTADQWIDKLPNGAVVNIVHADSPRSPVLISHQGFVIRKDGVTYFRHANPPGVIRNQPMKDYLKIVTAKKTWPVVGVNVNAVQDGTM